MNVSVILLTAAALTANPSALTMDEVLVSVDRHFPSIVAAEFERNIARGDLQRARGDFDVGLGADWTSAPGGFYRNDVGNLQLERQLQSFGAKVRAGYRFGRGDFASYDGKLLTNSRGEFRIGASVPLAKDRAIDDSRAELAVAEIGVARAEPIVLEQRMKVSRKAMLAYWEWLAAGEKDRIARDLVNLAESRQLSLQAAVEEGLIAEIVLVDNERLIAERRALRISTERRLQQAAIELSLYLRDRNGETTIPEPSRLPLGFPKLERPTVDLEADVTYAQSIRPETRKLQLEIEQKTIEMRRARNKVLPNIDLRVDASQDEGQPVGTPDTKGQFELEAGIAFDLPLQRRRARGEFARKDGERAKLEQLLRLENDFIGVEVRDAHSAWVQAFRRFEQAVRSVELARELEEAERLQLREGNSDLLRLNIREQQTAGAASFVVDVATEYFEAQSDYRAAILDLPTLAIAREPL